jgi:hypothetical protein
MLSSLDLYISRRLSVDSNISTSAEQETPCHPDSIRMVSGLNPDDFHQSIGVICLLAGDEGDEKLRSNNAGSSLKNDVSLVRH